MNERYGEFEQVNGATVNAAFDRAELAEAKLKMNDKTSKITDELKALRKIYNAVNLMMIELGATGEIGTRHTTVTDLMCALLDFDGGVYNEINPEQQ